MQRSLGTLTAAGLPAWYADRLLAAQEETRSKKTGANDRLAMGIVGIGIGFAFTAMSNLVVEAVPVTQTGVATGMNANVRTIGGSIGTQVVSAVIVAGVVDGAIPHEHGYVLAFLVMGVALALAGVAAALVPSREARRAAAARIHPPHTVPAAVAQEPTA
jgi:MFS family permease